MPLDAGQVYELQVQIQVHIHIQVYRLQVAPAQIRASQLCFASIDTDNLACAGSRSGDR